MREDELRELGIFRIPVPIPFIEAGGPINVYAVEEEEGLLLFDTGLETAIARQALAGGLARIGRRFEEINRIVLSHGHIDHFGAAAWLVEQIGREVPVMIHGADADKVLESSADWPTLLRRNRGYLLGLGVPVSLLEEVAEAIGRNAASLGRRVSAVTQLNDGDLFRCRHVTLEVLYAPGHTRGLCCLYERDHRLLFSADHLLECVSPNPLIELSEPGAFKPLISYFDSLDRVRPLPVDLVLPGHAAPFAEPLKVIESLDTFYRRRQSKILKVLRRGPLSVYELMSALFGSGGGFEFVMMISEALGNLELLEHRGEVERETESGVTRFRAL